MARPEENASTAIDAISRRIPGTRVGDYLRALGLRRAKADSTVSESLDRESALFRRLWQPLAVAALNTEVETGAAALLNRVLAESFGRGGSACR